MKQVQVKACRQVWMHRKKKCKKWRSDPESTHGHLTRRKETLAERWKKWRMKKCAWYMMRVNRGRRWADRKRRKKEVKENGNDQKPPTEETEKPQVCTHDLCERDAIHSIDQKDLGGVVLWSRKCSSSLDQRQRNEKDGTLEPRAAMKTTNVYL